jgi:hypothetical protein
MFPTQNIVHLGHLKNGPDCCRVRVINNVEKVKLPLIYIMHECKECLVLLGAVCLYQCAMTLNLNVYIVKILEFLLWSISVYCS